MHEGLIQGPEYLRVCHLNQNVRYLATTFTTIQWVRAEWSETLKYIAELDLIMFKLCIQSNQPAWENNTFPIKR